MLAFSPGYSKMSQSSEDGSILPQSPVNTGDTQQQAMTETEPNVVSDYLSVVSNHTESAKDPNSASDLSEAVHEPDTASGHPVEPDATFGHPDAVADSNVASILPMSDRGCGRQMVHSFRNKEEFAYVHREGSIIEMANEEAECRRFNNSAAERNAWVVRSLPGPYSLISSELQTQWVVLVELPRTQEKLFPDEGEDCTLGFKCDFSIAGKPFNPGMLKARRVPNPYEDLPALSAESDSSESSILATLAEYSAHAVFHVTMEYIADPVTKQRFHPLETIAILQPSASHHPVQLNAENAVKVTLRVTAQLVTHEAELKAIAQLTEHTRNLGFREERARQTLNYLLDFRREPSFWVDLLAELPHMDRPDENPLTPSFLKTVYNQLNTDHKKVYEQLRKLPAGLALILGCPGAGKTALNAFIAAMALSQPVTDEVGNRTKQRPVKILYLLDVNDPCDDAANRVYRILKDAGIHRRVVRVRGCAREMSRSAKLHPGAKPGKDDTSMVPDFTSGFLKQARLSREDGKTRRDPHKAPFLDEAAWEKFDADRHQYEALSKLLDKLDGGATRTKSTASELKVRVSRLYFTVIKNADFIATTPVGASGQLSMEFQPDIVFVDEAAHARELTSLMPLAFSPARAYIFTGDTRQTRPYVQGASMTRSEIREKGLRKNPYAKQLMISTMERADLAGALTSRLLITHRMYGNLHLLASQLFYDGLLTSGMPSTGLFPPPVQHIQNWLRRFTYGHDCAVPRVLINYHTAQEQRDRTSFYNPAHESFIRQRCLELLCETKFERIDKPDQPGRILIITPYKAALYRYKQFTNVLPPYFRGRIDVELRHGAMEARTVDSAQGHEADFVFVDTVRTTTAGFLDDPKRLCVMLTRARIGEMILMHEGMAMRRRNGVLVEAEWTSKVYNHCRENNQLYRMG